MPRPRARFNIGPEDDTTPPIHTLRHLLRTGLEQIREVKTVLMTMWEQSEEIEKMLNQADDILATMNAGESSGHEQEPVREEHKRDMNGVLQFPALRSPRGTEMGFPGLM